MNSCLLFFFGNKCATWSIALHVILEVVGDTNILRVTLVTMKHFNIAKGLHQMIMTLNHSKILFRYPKITNKTIMRISMK